MSCVTSSTARGSAASASPVHSWSSRTRDRVQRRKRLVQQQDGTRGEQRARERHALAHTAGQLVGARGGELAEPEALEQLAGPAPGLAPPDAAQLERQTRVVERRAPRQEEVALRHQDAGGKPVGGRRTALHGDLPARRLLQAGNDLEQGGLPAARGADQPQHLAGDDLERHAPQRRHAAATRREVLRQRGDRHGRLGRPCRLPSAAPSREPSRTCAACSLRGDYPTGSKGQRREGVPPLAAISARCAREPPWVRWRECTGGNRDLSRGRPRRAPRRAPRSCRSARRHRR